MSDKVLDGVPRLSYGSGERFTPMGSLRAVAEYMGIDVTYPWLMGSSGGAFRTAWSDHWSLEMTHSAPEDLVANGGRVCGLDCTSHVNGDQEEAWRSIKTSIDASRPVISCGLAGAPEFCVIYGYREDPQSLHVTGYFQREAEVPYKPWMGWNYEGYGQFPLVLVRKAETEKLSLGSEGLERALRFSEGEGPLAARARDRGLHFGLEAYDAWANALKEVGGDLEGKAFNMALNLNAMLDARRTAGEYLQIIAAMKEDWRKPLMRAYEHYRHQVAALAQARNFLYFPADLPEQAASKAAQELADPRLRSSYRRAIKAAKEEEMLSLEWIEKALKEA